MNVPPETPEISSPDPSPGTGLGSARSQVGHTGKRRRGGKGGSGDSQSPGPGRAKAKAKGKGKGLPLEGVRLLSIEQSAAYLGVGVWTARALLWNGSLPRVQLPVGGRRILVDVRDLDALVTKSKIQEEPGPPRKRKQP